MQHPRAGTDRPSRQSALRRSIVALAVGLVFLALAGATCASGFSTAEGANAPLSPTLRQAAALPSTGEVGAAGFGQSAALSANGTTALVGAESDNQNIGAVWVFARSGGAWAQQGPKLSEGFDPGVAGDGPALFGASVALSASGDVALIGSPSYNDVRGAAWLYTRSGGRWSSRPLRLQGHGEPNGGWFGSSVALSGNGAVALVGGSLDDDGAGAAWLFTRSGSRWVQDGPALTPMSTRAAAGGFGTSVALSSTGSVALVGANGGAYLFIRSRGRWTQVGGVLGSPGGAATSVALSANGTVGLIGEYAVNGTGSAWVVSGLGEPGSRRSLLHPSGATGEGEFGKSVALSADGSSAMVGAPLERAGVGAAWRFVELGGQWSQRGGPLSASGEVGNAQFGSVVSLSSAGTTALIGGPLDANATGGAWLFDS